MPPRLQLEVVSREEFAPAQPGLYQAFPTVTRSGPDRLLVAFRQGRVDDDWEREAGDHGGSGDVYVADSLDGGQSFGPPRLVVDHRWQGTNELDGLVTGLNDQETLLITRAHGPEIFGSFWALSQDQGQTFGPRQPLDLAALALDSGQSQPLACFGHVLPDQEEGGLLVSFYTYASYGDQKVGLARLKMDEFSFELVSWIWEGQLRGCFLNETAVVRLADGRLLAMCREEPCLSGLCFSWLTAGCWSSSGGWARTWARTTTSASPHPRTTA
ncbi:MAG: exo-alpha-sialidase [Deltaproteobacteria bacterium]|nr:exo-alpha-sialidase [Deltaproteobacteria bacterium]